VFDATKAAGKQVGSVASDEMINKGGPDDLIARLADFGPIST